jgi:hypothetical protein
MLYHLCRVRETSPGTHTFFHTYTCPVYCWRSVQLLDFSLYGGLIHASQPIRDFCSSGQCFASGFLQTPSHDDALAFGCILPTAGRIRDFHPLERAPAGRTMKKSRISPAFFDQIRNCSESVQTSSSDHFSSTLALYALSGTDGLMKSLYFAFLALNSALFF